MAFLISLKGGEKVKINVKGPIVSDSEAWIYSWFGIDTTTPKSINEALEKACSEGVTEITVVINSGGGSVFDASEIYTALKSFNGNVITQIVGLAASAASVIAMAGNKIEMSPTAQMMIHNASNRAEGDYQVMDENSAFLQNVNKSIMNAYISKTSKTEKELKALMDATTWMTAQQALEAGFIDAVMFENTPSAVASFDSNPELVNGVLPQSVIDKVRNELLKNQSHSNVINSVEHSKKEATNKMDYTTLKNEHPDLFNKVLNEGIEQGAKNERERIQNIEEFAMPGNEKIISNAKFNSNQTAAEVAMEILRNEKKIGRNYLHNRDEDAEEIEEVEPSSAPDEEKKKSEKEDEEVVENLTNFFKKGGTK